MQIKYLSGVKKAEINLPLQCVGSWLARKVNTHIHELCTMEVVGWVKIQSFQGAQVLDLDGYFFKHTKNLI